MKRYRLSTLMLLVIIAALGMGLIAQHWRAARVEAAMQAEIAKLRAEIRLIPFRRLNYPELDETAFTRSTAK